MSCKVLKAEQIRRGRVLGISAVCATKESEILLIHKSNLSTLQNVKFFTFDKVTDEILKTFAFCISDSVCLCCAREYESRAWKRSMNTKNNPFIFAETKFAQAPSQDHDFQSKDEEVAWRVVID